VIAADHDEYRSLRPERVAELMSGRVVIDAKAMLDAEQWRTAGFDVVRI
jgi:UDP-N-acetyl-D-mannosaminuronate dehydrogenase